jgi:solute carrier family 25 phosphate transporter 23/24/25/41
MSTPSSSTSGSSSRLSGRDIFDLTFSGSLDPPSLPLLKSDASPFLWRPPPRSLDDYRASETREQRERRLRALWRELPKTLEAVTAAAKNEETGAELTREEAEVLRRLYVKELMGRCDAHGRGKEVAGKEKEKADAAEVDWDSFVKYADAKEAGTWFFCTVPYSLANLAIILISELWTIFHDELDLDGNGHLDADELRYALAKAGKRIDSARAKWPLFIYLEL